MNHVKKFNDFLLEMLAAKHYAKRVEDRIGTFELDSLEGDDAAIVLIDRDDAKKRIKYLLTELATSQMKKVVVPNTEPPNVYAISFGEVRLKKGNSKVRVKISTDDGLHKGSVFYGAAINQKLITLLNFPANVKEDFIISKFFDNLRRSGWVTNDIDDFIKRFRFYTILKDTQYHIIDMDLDFNTWKKQIDEAFGKKIKSKEAMFSSTAIKLLNIPAGFRKEMVLSPGTVLSYYDKEGNIIEKTISNNEPPAATVKLDPNSYRLRFEEFKQVGDKKIPIAKTIKIGQHFIVTPKNVTMSDLEKIKLATGNKEITLNQIEGARFVGRIIELGQYSAEKYKSKFPVTFVRVEGTTVLL